MLQTFLTFETVIHRLVSDLSCAVTWMAPAVIGLNEQAPSSLLTGATVHGLLFRRSRSDGSFRNIRMHRQILVMCLPSYGTVVGVIRDMFNLSRVIRFSVRRALTSVQQILATLLPQVGRPMILPLPVRRP
jgi:hypothetical protein